MTIKLFFFYSNIPNFLYLCLLQFFLSVLLYLFCSCELHMTRIDSLYVWAYLANTADSDYVLLIEQVI